MEQPPLLASHYALQLDSEIISEDIDSGEQQTYRIAARGLVETTQHDSQVAFAMRPCEVILPTIAGGQPTLSDELIQSVDAVPIVGELTVDEEGVASLATDPAALVVGAWLEDPLNDPLPSDGDEPSAFDQDGDDEEGVTMFVPTSIGEVEVYLAARLTFSLSATVAHPASFSGESNASLEKVIFGDDSFLIDVKKLAAESEANSDIVSQQHLFTVTAIEPEFASCAPDETEEGQGAPLTRPSRDS
jgi:hypothetical protein